jgi:hypothetical protein
VKSSKLLTSCRLLGGKNNKRRGCKGAMEPFRVVAIAPPCNLLQLQHEL